LCGGSARGSKKVDGGSGLAPDLPGGRGNGGRGIREGVCGRRRDRDSETLREGIGGVGLHHVFKGRLTDERRRDGHGRRGEGVVVRDHVGLAASIRGCDTLSVPELGGRRCRAEICDVDVAVGLPVTAPVVDREDDESETCEATDDSTEYSTTMAV
jgi:hypothetical protein